MKRSWKRMAAGLLTLVMVCSVLPTSVWAAQGETPEEEPLTAETPVGEEALAAAQAPDSEETEAAETLAEEALIPTVEEQADLSAVTYQYVLDGRGDANGVPDGVYGFLLRSSVSSSVETFKSLYHAAGGANTNNNTYTSSDTAHFASGLATWTYDSISDAEMWEVKKQERGGYTLRSVADGVTGETGYYLTGTHVSGSTKQTSGLSVESTTEADAQTFDIAYLGSGTYSVKVHDGDYLAFTDDNTTRWTTGTSANVFRLYKRVEVISAPTIPGYTQVTATTDLATAAGSNQYLIVAMNSQNDVFALNPNTDAESLASGNTVVAGQSSIAARLTVSGTTVTATSVQTGDTVSMANLHLVLASSGDSSLPYTLQTLDSSRYVALGDKFCTAASANLSIAFSSGNLLLRSSARTLDFNDGQDGIVLTDSDKSTWVLTNFAGWNGTSVTPAFPVFLYKADSSHQYTTQDVEPEKGVLLRSATAGMFNESAGENRNSWVFLGGRAAQGSYADIGGAKDYVSELEEYLRWTLVTSSIPGRQRHMTNASYEGLTLAQAVSDSAGGWARVTSLDPKAVSYLISYEDYQAGTAGLTAFKANVAKLVEKGLALRGGTGFVVIQTPYTVADATLNGYAAAYAQAAREAAYSENFRSGWGRIVFVDHLTQTAAVSSWTTDYLNEADANGAQYPNYKGHLELGRQLALTLYGSAANYPQTHTTTDYAGNNLLTPLDSETSAKYNWMYSETAEADLTPAQQKIKALVDGDESVTWLFMGDSITHGCAWMYGYDQLSQAFEKFVKDDLGRKTDLVVNTAVSGAYSGSNSSNGTVNFLDDRLNSYNPDVVSIMIGTNDAASHTVSLANYKKNLRTILDAILAKGAVPILRVAIPDAASGRGEFMYEYGSALWEVANEAAYQGQVIVVDQWTEWTSYLMQDQDSTATTFLFGSSAGTAVTPGTIFDRNNIHPGPEGQLWIAHELIDAMGLWDDDSAICNLNYSVTASFPDSSAFSSVTPTLYHDAAAGTITLDVDVLNYQLRQVDATASVLEATITANGVSSRALRGQTAVLTGQPSTGSVSVTVTALVGIGSTSGATVTLTQTVDMASASPSDPRLVTIPGYTQVTDIPEGGFDANAYYILVSKDSSGNLYALYPHASGVSLSSGNGVASSGTVTAKLTVNGDAVSAVYLADSSALDMNHLFFTIRHEDGEGYVFWSMDGGSYLSAQDNLFSQSENYLTIVDTGDIDFQLISDTGRYVAFSLAGDTSPATVSNTNWWGPNGVGVNPIYIFRCDTDSPLQSLYDQYVTLTNDDGYYSAGSWNALQAALTAAKAVLDKGSAATSEEGNDAYDALLAAYNNLRAGVSLPDGFTISTHIGTRTTTVENGMVVGIYAPVSGRPRLMHVDGTTTNQCEATTTDNGNVVDMNTHTAQHSFTLVASGSGYLIQSVQTGQYLTTTASGSQLTVASTGSVFTVSTSSTDTNGVYLMSGGQYLSFSGSGWAMSSSAYTLYLYAYKVTEETVEGAAAYDYDQLLPALPVDQADQPYTRTTMGGPEFRIPGMVTLQYQQDDSLNGRIVSFSDARWSYGNDANNIDTLVSYSDDNGATWNYSWANYWNDAVYYTGSDQTTSADSYVRQSADTIDALIAEGRDGTVYLLVDAFPGGIATLFTNTSQSSGYVTIDGKKRMVLYTFNNDPEGTQTESNYSYYVGDFVDGYATIYDAGDGSDSGLYLDARYYLYRQTGSERTPDNDRVYCPQLNNETVWVQQNVFFYNASLHVRGTNFMWLFTSTDGGTTWSAPQDLNSMIRTGENYAYIAGPGNAISLDDGTIVMPMYQWDETASSQRSSFIYLPQGKAENGWKRTNTASSSFWTSESCVVQLDDSTIRMFFRSADTVLSYVDYTLRADGVWYTSQVKKQADATATKNGVSNSSSGCQISALKLKDQINGKNVVVVSTPSNTTARENGKLYVFLIEEDKSMTLVNSYAIGSLSNTYGYSTLSQLGKTVGDTQAGDIALLYENWIDPLNNECFITVPLEDVVPTATVTGYDGVYDGAEHAVTVTFSVKDPSEYTIEYTMRPTVESSWNAAPFSFTEAGSYKVYWRVKVGNYLYDTNVETVRIEPVPVHIYLTSSASMLMGGGAVDLTVTGVPAATGGKLTLTCLDDGKTIALTRNSTPDSDGTYTYTGSVTLENKGATHNFQAVYTNSNGNYAGAQDGCTIQVLESTDGSMTFSVAGYNDDYDGQPHTATYNAGTSQLLFSDDEGQTYTLTTPPSYTDAGSYTVYYQAIGIQNSETVTVPGEVTVKISPATLPLDIDANQYYFSGADFNDDAKPLTLTVTGIPFDSDGGDHSDIGTFTMVVKGQERTNYVTSTAKESNSLGYDTWAWQYQPSLPDESRVYTFVATFEPNAEGSNFRKIVRTVDVNVAASTVEKLYADFSFTEEVIYGDSDPTTGTYQVRYDEAGHTPSRVLHIGNGVTVEYSYTDPETGEAVDWTETAPVFTDPGTYVIQCRGQATGCESVTLTLTMQILDRQIVPPLELEASPTELTGGGTVTLSVRTGVPSGAGTVTVTYENGARTVAQNYDGTYTVTLMNSTDETQNYTFQADFTPAEGEEENYTAASATCDVTVYPSSAATAVDKTRLENLVASGEALSESDYSSGWADFQTALSDAKAVLADGSATQTQVDDAWYALVEATQGLTKKSSSSTGGSSGNSSSSGGSSGNSSGGITVENSDTDGNPVISTTVDNSTGVVIQVVDAGKDEEPVVRVTVPKDISDSTVSIPLDIDYTTVAVDAATGEIINLSVPSEDLATLLVQLDGSTQLLIQRNPNSFEDVSDQYWAKDAVDFTYAHRLFLGVSDREFAPELSMSRAMMLTVLARFAGVDTASGDTWYQAGADWAMSIGLSDGTNLENDLSREQLATMLWRYAGCPEGVQALDSYADSASVSGYAQAAMKWAVAQGLIQGTDAGLLDPQGSASRAQVSTLMLRFCRYLVD